MSCLPIKSRLLFCLSLVAMAMPSFAQYHGLDAALDAAAKQYDQAQIQGDRVALQRLVADDYLLMRSNGTVVGKKELIDLVAHTGQTTDPYTVEKPFSRVYGNVAILGGWVHLAGSDQGKRFTQNMRFADTWARRNGRWYVVFTALAPTDKP